MALSAEQDKVMAAGQAGEGTCTVCFGLSALQQTVVVRGGKKRTRCLALSAEQHTVTATRQAG